MVDILNVVKTGQIKLSQEEEQNARMLYQNATKLQPYNVRKREWRKDWLAFKFALVREKERQANGGDAVCLSMCGCYRNLSCAVRTTGAAENVKKSNIVGEVSFSMKW